MRRSALGTQNKTLAAIKNLGALEEAGKGPGKGGLAAPHSALSPRALLVSIEAGDVSSTGSGTVQSALDKIKHSKDKSILHRKKTHDRDEKQSSDKRGYVARKAEICPLLARTRC